MPLCESVLDVTRPRIFTRKHLKGHINKVNDLHFSGDSRHAVSCSLDGKLIIWDVWTGNKTQVVPLKSSWVMSVAFSSSGNLVGSGGMDNQCTIHDLSDRDGSGSAKVVREITGFDGFLSCVRFLQDTQVITGSADTNISTWDVRTGEKAGEHRGHTGDVVGLSLSPDGRTFITGSVDKTARLWDLRSSGNPPIQTFLGHESDVNAVFYHPSGYSFVTASEDKTCRLFDIRSDQEVEKFGAPTPNSTFSSVVLSASGRLLLAGSDDSSIHMWDTLKSIHVGNLVGHENRITSLSIAENGYAMVSGSWDTIVRVWG
ncbi:unnamed protein product [Darwinula stevensoni]|uniref:Uncharacterized protein n=1 Tax=Darwinula stevensoni TaxID=69355 RepID=A0A7R8XIT4_9CRUS|nr:unnamed protein product [Darwinula stevensoni]CAG0893742.1 unnamed protein product [Darwinula stevensoni]